ncbi:hypothetical protein DY000_02017350 [Brassica cretica]|uniref:CCHC-type domain-containing protein n=1 Tax=Brassica cretica TaxID=69181 RepID=A0ABQ7CR03_BRACR|nr:hypothetical protein DY000_02017350 [Brassica cretica]
MIVAGFTEPKKDHGYELIEKLEAGVQNMLQIVEDRKRDTVAPKQKEILLYVVLKNVPPQLYSLDGICVVASGIGDPLQTEKSRLDPYHFGDTKVKVEIDLSQTPPEVVEVRDTQGNSVRINVEYPNLPPKCLNCGKYGHLMNRCHKPLVKKTQVQKKEKVVSVVKSGEDVSLVAAYQGDDPKGKEEECIGVSLRARSRSLRRSQSRERARARALSSPSEGARVVGREALVAEELKGSLEASKASVETVLNSEVESVMVEKLVIEGDKSFEEGEIEEVEEEVEKNSSKMSQGGAFESKEEESVWITKHSKSYRRALRQ